MLRKTFPPNRHLIFFNHLRFHSCHFLRLRRFPIRFRQLVALSNLNFSISQSSRSRSNNPNFNNHLLVSKANKIFRALGKPVRFFNDSATSIFPACWSGRDFGTHICRATMATKFRSTTLNLQRPLPFLAFLFIEQPVRITPGFIGHFWDGPETLGPFGTGFDLPETAFSAFLTAEHYSNPDARAGVESNFTVGVYSDYEHLDSDSLRITGVGLGWFRIDEVNIFKFGVEYFDRLELKLLPAFGLFIRPTNYLQLDLYFPRPRIAQRLPSFRAIESWLYIAGEYGGGNWTVQRDFGDDRIDINDYRALLGIEWYNQRGVTGFFEIGYVFNRELISQAAMPTRSLDLQDTIILRSGLEF